jgi:hypothetical protein
LELHRPPQQKVLRAKVPKQPAITGASQPFRSNQEVQVHPSIEPTEPTHPHPPSK